VAFARPTLAELITRIGGDMRGRLSIGGPLLRRAMVDVLANVWAGGVHTLYGFVDWASKQLFGDTADSEVMLRRAAMYGITPVAATFATGNVTATGTNGFPILAGTILKLDAATSYRVVTGQVIAAGTATLPVIAVLAGAAANLIATATLTFETPVAGVTSTALVATGGLAGGNDQQSPADVLDRYLLRLREPPEGGSDQDYEGWALAVAGVTRAWVYRNELGLGTVVVRFVRDLDVSIFPDAGEVAAVQAAIAAKRPTTAEPTAVAPTALTVAFTIHIVPDNADTRVAVTAQLVDLFARVAEPGDGVGRGTVLLSAINTAVGVAEAVTDYTLTVPSASVVPSTGQLPVVGTITWV
jgi:uncharacterized phage protein gp47/JayE